MLYMYLLLMICNKNIAGLLYFHRLINRRFVMTLVAIYIINK